MKDTELREVLNGMGIIRLRYMGSEVDNGEIVDQDLRFRLDKEELISMEFGRIYSPQYTKGLASRVAKLEMQLAGLMKHLGVEADADTPMFHVSEC